uniref:Splicing factor YJU2 n=1 Tax=Oryza meridionalis TaxID=40149 RepID=A0A0E0C418_9ORYZ
MVVRMMLPMTVRCAACGEYIGRGTKFNSRKEDVAGERYLGAVQVFRFYIRCSRCSAEIVFRTDPANAGYALESGATRPSYEPWPAAVAEAGWEERGDDAMTALEGRCRDARREMGVDAALEEMRSLKSRRAGVTPEQVLESLRRRRAGGDRGEALAELEEDDEKLIRSIAFGNAKEHVLRRIDDGDEDDEEDFFESCLVRAAMATSHQAKKRPPPPPPPRDAANSLVVSKKRRPVSMDQAAWPPSSKTSTASPSSGKTTASNGALQALCCNYDDDEEEES